MDARGGRLPRLLLLAAGVVCCYVLFYNALMLDRRPVARLLATGRLVYPDTGGPAAAYLLNGSSPSAAVRRLESAPAQKTEASAAPATTTASPRKTTRGPTRPAAAHPTIEQVYQPGFRSSGAALCPDGGSHQLVVILITTAPSHQRQRRAIRMTWGAVALRRDVTLAFVVGATSDAEEQRTVEREQETYGDLIQSRTSDGYRNLTLKTVAMLEWLDTHCPHARIVLKTDDDMFINTENLLRFAEVHRERKNTLFGRLAHRWKPIRNAKSKYYLSQNVYPSKFLPDFTTGPAYVLTGDLVSSLYRESLKMPFLHLEDVLVTGMVGDKLKVKRVSAKEFINDRIRIDTCKLQTAISVHMVKFDEQFDMWKRVSDGKTRCPRPYKPTGG